MSAAIKMIVWFFQWKQMSSLVDDDKKEELVAELQAIYEKMNDEDKAWLSRVVEDVLLFREVIGSDPEDSS